MTVYRLAVDALDVATEQAQRTPAGPSRRFLVYFQVFKAIVIGTDTQSPVAIFLFQVVLPEVRWRQDMAVGIHCSSFGTPLNPGCAPP